MKLQTIREIDAVLPAVGVDQTRIDDRDHVIQDMKNVLSQVQDLLKNMQT
jgi:hypothetical protein